MVRKGSSRFDYLVPDVSREGVCRSAEYVVSECLDIHTWEKSILVGWEVGAEFIYKLGSRRSQLMTLP